MRELPQKGPSAYSDPAVNNIRTLSMWNPAYNPYSYHRGSVWPVEQATFVLGFVRFGLHAHAHRLTRSLFEAARIFESCRLPELFAGHPRDPLHPFPALYPQANSPQAWSAASPLLLLRVLLGLDPDVPSGSVRVAPSLPGGMDRLVVRGLRLWDGHVDVAWRDGTLEVNLPAGLRRAVNERLAASPPTPR